MQDRRDIRRWRCRIGKVTPKVGGATIHQMPQPDGMTFFDMIQDAVDEAHEILPAQPCGFAFMVWDEQGSTYTDFGHSDHRPIYDLPEMVKAALTIQITRRLMA